VLFEYVAENESIARAYWMAAHLVNTFLLLASQTLTAWWLTRTPEVAAGPRRAALATMSACAVGMLLVGASGAVAALGDTLFPEQSLSAALAADLSATSHVLIRLRILHPALAVLTAAALIFAVPRLSVRAATPGRRLGHLLAGLAAFQLAAGALNVILLAPVWMQILHLLLADLMWIVFVVLGATLLGVRQQAPASERVGRTQLVGEALHLDR
jgi:heme A synthase